MKSKEYPDIPKMPDSFIDRIIDKKVIIFVGAGISALCKYPLWNKLADNIIEDFRKDGLIDYQFEHSIKNGSYSPIQKITILSEYLENGQELVNDRICEYLDYDENHCDLNMASKVADYLFSFNSSIVTTNADLILDKNDLSNKYEKYSSVRKVSETNGFNRLSILHLHGSIEEKANLIFTERQYAENYLPNAKLGRVLTKLIKSDNTILFIGYSMREFELLKYFINPSNSEIKNRLFKLDAYFHDEENTRLELDNAYCSALGITLLPYFIDKKGYEALMDVLDNWTSKIGGQISPSGIVHLDIADAISRKPTSTSVKLIQRNFNCVDPAFIQNKVSISSFYKEWIKALWNNTPLFDPVPYFTVLPSKDNITRVFWSGLLILREYIRKGSSDEVIEKKLAQAMTQVGTLLKTKKTQIAELNNSDSISILLSEIVMGRTKLIGDSNVFDPITKFYISKNQYGAYMLAEDFLNNRERLINELSSERVFEIISLIASNDKKEREHYEVLNSSKMTDFVLANPKPYYKRALNQLKKADWLFSNVGSFLHFPNEKNNFMYELRLYASWLLTATPYIETQIIKKDINSLLRSKKKVLNKMGLCLLGLRLESLVELFIDKISVFFNKYQYTADLIQLINNNADFFRESNDLQIILQINLEKGDFGCKDPLYGQIIKKAVSNALSLIDSRFQKYNLSESEKEIVFHLDSSASFFNVDTKEEINKVYEKIKDKEIDEMISYVNGLNEGHSFFFDTSAQKAVDMYLSKKNYSAYKDKIRNINNHYLVSYMCNTSFVPADNDGIQKFIYLYSQTTKEEKKKYISSILFACHRMVEIEDIKKEYKEKLIKLIDYKEIEIETLKENEIKIGMVINSTLYLYWSILSDLTKFNEDFASKLFLESVVYFYVNYKNLPLFKAIMASWFAFVYYYESNDNKEKYFQYVFNEGDCSTSFRIFSYLHNTDFYLTKLCELESFNVFVSNNKDSSQERVVLAARIICAYLYSNDLENTYEMILDRGDIEAIERSFYSIAKNSDEFVKGKYKDRFFSFIEKCEEVFEKSNKRIHSVNQILQFVIEIMIKEKGEQIEELWNLLFQLPKGLTYYHDDSIANLLLTFKDTDSKNCIRFLDSFFKSYESAYIIDSYLVDLFILLKRSNLFNNELRRWQTILGNKNPSIYDALSKVILSNE